MIKAIFFDVDGTLLSFNTHTVPQSAIDAIHAVQQKGIKVIIATGRILNLAKSIEGIAFDGYITLNGAHCSTTDGKVIGATPIPRKELEALLDYEENVQHFAFTFMLENDIYINTQDNDRVRLLSEMVEVPIPPVADMHSLLDEEVFQLNLYIDEAVGQEVMREALTGCELSRWHPLFADANLKGINKRVGIEAFLQHYGIDQSETMAFGDGGNDIEMLKFVGTGVAMGNAGNEVKAIADYVTDSVDDNGIANALRHFGVI